jgi:prepilin-type N-terminal cleavage/methylation domain-containing protein
MLTRARWRDDTGFTLPELLLSITILGLIIVSIGGSVGIVLHLRGETADRLASSPDYQNTADFFTGDGQSATAVTTGAAAGCGSTTAALVTFTGADYAAGSTVAIPTTRSYVVVTNGTSITLHRRACGSPSDDAVHADIVVARSLKATPVLVSSCDGTTTPFSATAVIVGMRVTEIDGTTFTVCARRRVV